MEQFRNKRGYICDMDGVIYHGNRLLPGVKEFVDWLYQEDKKFLFLTNSSSKTPRELQDKLARMGLDVDEKHFYTSALATAEFIAAQNPGATVYGIGEPALFNALYEKGLTIYLSPNTNDNPEWQATVQHIALEGKCYFINCDMFFTRADYPQDLHCPEELAKLPEIVCRGGSCIVDPYGHYVVEPVWDREEILYADLEMEKTAMSRMELDVCGHYARPDVLRLSVQEA